MQTLEQRIIESAPMGRSIERGLPGGWTAIVAKPFNRAPFVWYIKRGGDDVPAFEWAQAARYLAA